MNNIVLTRIDSRLIHGQVMTKWVKQYKIDCIVIVSNDLAEDEFMRDIYLMSAPEGVEIVCLTEFEAVSKYNSEELGNGRVLLLIPSVSVMERIYEQGIRVKEIQIGGMGSAPKRKVVYQNITLDYSDANSIENLVNDGVNVLFQVIPEDAPRKATDVLNKFRT